ncbi:MAG: hypothetical protein JRJ87_20830 [Deltaproteobacteria bacterium]|nr:hypothetical protein [Deltaproteobacteria bacterium]
MNKRWTSLFLLVAFHCAWLNGGCKQTPGNPPELHRIIPDIIGLAEEHYLIVEGENFIPAFSLSTEDNSLQANSRFYIRFDDGPEFQAVLLSSSRLSVQAPANLAPGSHAVSVISPSGKTARLQDGLFVDQEPKLRIVYTCQDLSWLDVCSTNLGGTDTRILATRILVSDTLTANSGLTDTLIHPYSLSSDGHNLAFFRKTGGENGGSLQLWLKNLTAGWETMLFETSIPSQATNPLELISTPVFSPDNNRLVYILEKRNLMIQKVPQDSRQVEQAQLLFSEAQPASGELVFKYPEIDPADRFVLFTRVHDYLEEPSGDVDVSLHLTPLNGDPIRPLIIDHETYGAKDGPGVFMPSGDKVIFLSTRSNLIVPTPFGWMGPVTNLYQVDLFGGPVEPVSTSMVAYMYGKPAVAPNGRLVASNGYLADVSGSGLDIIVTDLKTGFMSRAGSDPVRYCVPQDVFSDCKLPYWSVSYLLRCCSDYEDETSCCDFDSGMCPTWELAPSFSPDSRNLIADGLAYQWVCLPGKFLSDPWHWAMSLTEYLIYFGALTEKGIAWSEHPLTTGSLEFPPSALFMQILDRLSE